MNNISYKSLIFPFIVLFLALISPQQSWGNSYNGFDLSIRSIPKEEIILGGPPKDGIPAIIHPKFVNNTESQWLNDDDLVVGVEKNGTTKAYPLRILLWHEAVNDEINGDPVLVNYCPLCGSAMVFKRNIKEKTFTFGISGLLHQSNVLFYDHQTESLWSQLDMKAVTGEMNGTEFEVYPSTMSTWEEWKKKYPKTLVLSKNTGFSRNYNRDPYAGYEDSKALIFPVKHQSAKFHPKEKILVVIVDEHMKAYPFTELDKVEDTLVDSVGDKQIEIIFNSGKFVEVKDRNGDKRVKSFVTYWFAWYAFKPDTPLYER